MLKLENLLMLKRQQPKSKKKKPTLLLPHQRLFLIKPLKILQR